MNDITQDADYDIRYSEKGDEWSLRQWLTYPGMLDCFPMRTRAEKDLVVTNWIGFARYTSSLTAVYKGKPVGMATLFLMPYKKVAHLSTLYFIVDPTLHRQGIGRSLIKNSKHLGATRFHLESIHLDVYEDSAAESVLKQSGFIPIFRQEKFVKEAEGRYKARILMETKLT